MMVMLVRNKLFLAHKKKPDDAVGVSLLLRIFLQ